MCHITKYAVEGTISNTCRERERENENQRERVKDVEWERYWDRNIETAGDSVKAMEWKCERLQAKTST